MSYLSLTFLYIFLIFSEGVVLIISAAKGSVPILIYVVRVVRHTLMQVTGEKIPRSKKLPTEKLDWIRMGVCFTPGIILLNFQKKFNELE